jgi:autotransporter-associated beta strand protein
MVTNSSLAFNGDIEVQAGKPASRFFMQATSAAGTSHVIGGTIWGGGGVTYSADNYTVCEVRAVQTYTGDTVIRTNGTLRLVGAGSLPDTGRVWLENATAAFDLNGVSDTVGRIYGLGQVLLGGATLTTGGDNGNSTLSGVISGNGNIVKNGTGIFTLSEANTYQGTTTVNAGTLRIGGDNRLPSNTTLSVAAGVVFDLNGNNQAVATLSGAGTVTTGVGILTIANALNPGTSAGAITLGNFNLAGGATMTVELDGANPGTQYDQVVATGDVALAGSLSLSLSFAPSNGQQFIIINKTSAGAVKAPSSVWPKAPP